jgi:hypothetical protein
MFVSPASAWNAAGHKIIASIAFRQLTPAEQGKVVAILKRHPRFSEDFAEQMPDDIRTADEATQNEWLFQQAAVWADMVRSGPPEKQAFNRGEWHYVNLPVWLNDAARAELENRLTVNRETETPASATLDTARMNVVQVIRFARKSAADKDASPQDRAVMLAWVFHTVGDIHQPLHGAALFSTQLLPDGDRGGNSIKTIQSGNLHALWDNFPGSGDSFRESRNSAIGYDDRGIAANLGAEAVTSLDASVWAAESNSLAKRVVYDDEVLSALRRMETSGGGIEELELSESYLRAGGGVAKLRVAQAGYRLGAVLKQIAESQ